jgi:hypothetical protein
MYVYIYEIYPLIYMNVYIIILLLREERRNADGQKIGKLIKVVRTLTQLTLEIGTLIAVIKMIIESIQ